MKQLLIVLSFCAFAYGFLLPRDFTLKDLQPKPDQTEAHRKVPPEEVQAGMNILIRKFLINQFQQPMPKLNTGVFTQEAWLKTRDMYNSEKLLNERNMVEDK